MKVIREEELKAAGEQHFIGHMLVTCDGDKKKRKSMSQGPMSRVKYLEGGRR